MVLVFKMIVVSFLESVMKSGKWRVPQNEQSKRTEDSAKLYL
jgi:hypothetical protein